MQAIEPTPTSDDAVQQTIDMLYRTISPIVDGCESYAILDFPDHSNVGDSAIFLGEMKLLETLCSRSPAHVSSTNSYAKDLNRLTPDGLVFLHGGGNFGDRWPRHQDFREKVLDQHPNRKIVQLPQSMQFDGEKTLDRCAAAIDSHRDFTLLVRDQESFDIAQSKFNCAVHMCPDAAFALGKLEPFSGPKTPVVSMLREDRESSFTEADIAKLRSLGPIGDWVDEPPNTKSGGDRFVERISRKVPFARPFLQPKLNDIYNQLAKTRVDRGIAQLSTADFVVTDRLHVHILATLLGIPHVVFDNNYGKISRFINAWPKSAVGHIVQDIKEAEEAIAAHRSTRDIAT